MSRAEYLDLAEQKIWEYLADDVMYPCVWAEKVVTTKRDEQKQADLVEEFAREVAAWSYWDDIIEEAEASGAEFKRQDIEQLAVSAMRADLDEWNALADNEQQTYFSNYGVE